MASKNTLGKTAVRVVEDDEKQKALKTAMDHIEKQFGKGAVMRLGENAAMSVEHIKTGSLMLDAALGIGGIPKGRIFSFGIPFLTAAGVRSSSGRI